MSRAEIKRAKAVLYDARREFADRAEPLTNLNKFREIRPAVDAYLDAISAGLDAGLDADGLAGCDVSVARWALELTQHMLPQLIDIADRALDRAGAEAVIVAARGDVIPGGASAGQFRNPYRIPERFAEQAR